MAADLFETYAVTAVAVMLLGVLTFHEATARRALPAGARGRGDHRLDHRHLRRALAGGQRRAGALPGSDRLRRDRGCGLRPDHLLDDGRPHLQGRRCPRPDSLLGAPLPLLADRDRGHRLSVRDHRLLHLDPLLAGQEDRESVDHRPRHEHHPGLRLGPAGDGAAGDRAGARGPRLVEARRGRRRRHLRRRRRGHGPALADRPDRRARRLRSDHRQRRRDRRDGRPARGGPQRHRPARRGRQHDQGGHQGVRDRLGRAGGGGAVRGLPRRTDRPIGSRRRTSRSTNPRC